MNRLIWWLTLLLISSASSPAVGIGARPNVVFILADDLGYGDVGCYGQKLIRTPNIDRLAKDGMRFTDFYAGATVCAPSRCVLMTGKHNGHASVRGNAGRGNTGLQTLREGDRTVAHLFRDAGYATALFGKWGLGEVGSTGHPNRMGFDEFFGFLSQQHAHNYFPSFLFRNSARVPLRNVPEIEDTEVGDGWAREKVEYAPTVIFNEAIKWVTAHKDQPFFLYYSPTLPHANNEATRGTGNGQEIPDYGIYKNKPWPDPDKGQAAMVSYLDKQVGELRDTLKQLGLAANTLIIFSSDNGPHKEGNNHPEFFKAGGPLRGTKRALYEGGIRVPFIAAWPGRIKPRSVNHHVGYFGDFFSTAAELTGQPMPAGLDSSSLLPELTASTRTQPPNDYVYWEFYEEGGRQAVRFGNWKAIRQPMITGRVELFDLSTDIGEKNNLAGQQPGLVEKARAMMDAAHVPDPMWKVRNTNASPLVWPYGELPQTNRPTPAR